MKLSGLRVWKSEIAVIPITPPVAARASNRRSLTARGFGLSAATFVWVHTTGTPDEIAIASRLVRSPVWPP